jgi:pimeloyl-ACP methyl ester carboxylesterase
MTNRLSFVWAPPAEPTAFAALHARVLGDGSDTVLLVHGLGGSNRYWGAIFDDLGRTGRLFVPDLLGFGASSLSPAGYGVDDHAAAVSELLDELDVRGRIRIATHSFGTLVGLRLAALRGDQVSSITAFAPALYSNAAAARSHLRHSGSMARLGLVDGRLAQHACQFVCRHRPLAARVATWVRRDLPRAVAEDSVVHTWDSYKGTLQAMIDADVGRLLGEVDCPVSLVAGRRDRLLDRSGLAALDASPGVKLKWWDGDHHLPLRDPVRCCAAIVDAP